MTDNIFIDPVRHWLESFVIELNLCPFAKREFITNRVRFQLSKATTEQQLIDDLQHELERLNHDKSIETTLLIHPHVLQDFYVYNDFLDLADALLVQLNMEGIYQIASFHPDYHFADTEIDDVENYSNRSPFPLLHLIREDSLAEAVAHYPNPEHIPEHNIALLKKLGKDHIVAMFKSHFKTNKD
ncbi:MAG: DUF1415 domain-containing protein [Gammaproteobacteria bacterium]|nr:DUF1415 domain-containing protein [Gammaproteobacteria bacterium]